MQNPIAKLFLFLVLIAVTMGQSHAIMSRHIVRSNLSYTRMANLMQHHSFADAGNNFFIRDHVVTDPYSAYEKAQMRRFIQPFLRQEHLSPDMYDVKVIRTYQGNTKINETPSYFTSFEDGNLSTSETRPRLMGSLEFPFPHGVLIPDSTIMSLDPATLVSCTEYLAKCGNLYVYDARTECKITFSGAKAWFVQKFTFAYLIGKSADSGPIYHHFQEELIKLYPAFNDPILFATPNDPLSFHVRQIATVLLITY